MVVKTGIPLCIRTFLAFFVALALLAVDTAAFTVDIGPGELECFILEAEQGQTIVGNYELLTSGQVGPVRVTLTWKSPDDRPNVLKWEKSAEEEGTFSVSAEKGEYELCLANGDENKDDGMLRTFGFAFRTGGLDPDEHPELEAQGGGDAAAEKAAEEANRLEALVESAEALMEGLNTLIDHQSYMRSREEVHRLTTESTNSRVLWWTITEAAVLLCLAVWQISYISSCFETKRAL